MNLAQYVTIGIQFLHLMIGGDAASRRSDYAHTSTARGESHDEQAMPGLDSEAIDFRAASESLGIGKLQVGEGWGKRSAGRWVVGFVNFEDGGKPMSQQLDHCVQGTGLQ